MHFIIKGHEKLVSTYQISIKITAHFDIQIKFIFPTLLFEFETKISIEDLHHST